jgi:probable DNA metabolism protein
MERVCPTDFATWRAAARRLLGNGTAPDDVDWSDAIQPSLHIAEGIERAEVADGPALRVPRELLRLLEAVAQHRDPQRWPLMYRLLWNVRQRGRQFLDDGADPELRRAHRMAKEVRRDLHKMHAYVRFREIDGQYFAWFEPDQLTLREGARFFVRRFASMHWTIATPDGAAVWDQHTLQFIDAPSRETLPRDDPLETVWRTYYRSICNAARINPAAMQREMPQRYWKNLPEAAEIGILLRESARRVDAFDDPQARTAVHAPIRSSGPQLLSPPPATATLDACRRCALWESATQAVPGEGPANARIVLVGEQPGDEEDLRGKPFVGPAGRLLDELLREAGLDRATLYVTNAVKHFKWEPRGKRRLHKTPAQREVAACRAWLEGELAGLQATVVVALGATALRSLMGTAMAIRDARLETHRLPDGTRLIATYHPSALLRATDDAAELRRCLLEDLRTAASLID